MNLVFQRAVTHFMHRTLAILVSASLLVSPIHLGWAQTTIPAAPATDEQANGVTESPFGDGKRIALLIAQTDYRDAPLPSANQDVAMLNAQLQAAGFDTMAFGDLPEPAIAEQVRALTERLRMQGPDATVMVYVAGRFAQLNGDNILLPVGMPLQRASDATLNGFNIRKLIGALEGIPAKSRIVLFDINPPPPALTKERGYAPGLAIIDPPEGFLVSYSQGPNRYPIDPPAQVGLYSQALVEGINQPTADLGKVFEVVRMRVHTESNGLQIPWESSKLKGQEFSFYAPANGTPPLRSLVGDANFSDLRTLPRQEAYQRVIAADSIVSYQAFMEAFPDDDAVPSMQYNLALRREAEIWARAMQMNSPQAYWTYITMYPDGGNIDVAAERLRALGYPAAPPPGFQPVMFSDLPPPLPGREIVASSASMPLELAPRAPALGIGAAPALVGVAAAGAVAAIAVPAMMSRSSGPGRVIAVAPAVNARPAWAVPMAPTARMARPMVGAPINAPQMRAVAPSAPQTMPTSTPAMRPLMQPASAATPNARALPTTPAAGARPLQPVAPAAVQTRQPAPVQARQPAPVQAQRGVTRPQAAMKQQPVMKQKFAPAARSAPARSCKKPGRC